MSDLDSFLSKHNITMKDFKATKLKWDELQKIRENYNSILPDLKPTANDIIERLLKVKTIHSVRYRLKSPDSLIAKIIRKKIDDKRRRINLDNYKSEITDLIGIRVLHLFKEDWFDIHNFIKSTWTLHEKPIAYVRKGDNNEKYEKTDCEVRNHPYGYRSVHYLLKTTPTIKENFSEIQVRTIFEEGWSEIDHTVRYPKNMNEPILVQFSQILNRLAGSADEMGSYVIFLTNQLEKLSEEKKNLTQKKNGLINKLKKQIENLKIDPKKKISFENDLSNLVKISYPIYGLSARESKDDNIIDFLSLTNFEKKHPQSNIENTLEHLNSKENDFEVKRKRTKTIAVKGLQKKKNKSGKKI